MESIFVRYRNLFVLLALLVVQILGLAMQVRRTEGGRNVYDTRDGAGVRLIRLWANAIVSPPQIMIHASRLGLGGLWQNYIALHKVRDENEQLKQTVDRLRLEQALLLEDAKQGQRLQALMNFQEKYIYKTVAAQIIGASGTDLSRIFTLDKGSADGLGYDMAVITPDGIVGKIREVFPHSAQVLAINDQSSGAGVILETTRIRGILRGNATGRPQVVGILADQRIQPGEKVLTAGGDRIYPRGLPVGVVDKIVRDPNRDSYINVIVKSAAQIDRLDEVLVIVSVEPRFSAQQQQDMAITEQLKGAEAATIIEKKKASELMAERLPGLTDPNQPVNPDPKAPPLGPDLKAPAPLHPDRFSPSVVTGEPVVDKSGSPAKSTTAPAPAKTAPAPKSDAKSASTPTPRRTP